MGVDFLARRVLASRATGGRKLASGHEYPMCQDVASGHPKGRSAAQEPRSGLTRGSVLTPVPTSCGSSHPLFAIYARIYAADNRKRGAGAASVDFKSAMVSTWGRAVQAAVPASVPPSLARAAHRVRGNRPPSVAIEAEPGVQPVAEPLGVVEGARPVSARLVAAPARRLPRVFAGAPAPPVDRARAQH